MTTNPVARSLPSCSFFPRHNRDPVDGSARKRRDCGLHPDLDRFKRAQENISNQFGRGAGCEIERSLIAVSSVFAGEIRVKLLEVFITPVLERALGLGNDEKHVIRKVHTQRSPSSQKKSGSIRCIFPEHLPPGKSCPWLQSSLGTSSGRPGVGI